MEFLSFLLNINKGGESNAIGVHEESDKFYTQHKLPKTTTKASKLLKY